MKKYIRALSLILICLLLLSSCEKAGGHYNLITGVLRGEWGFNGFVLTDYEVGAGKGSYMNTLQSLAAGGDAKLKTVGMEALLGFDISKYPAYQIYGREAAHRILYTVVNSAGMNGFVHGVEYVPGFAYYKIILIVWDVLAAAGLVVLIILLVKKIRQKDAPELSSDEASDKQQDPLSPDDDGSPIAE